MIQFEANVTGTARRVADPPPGPGPSPHRGLGSIGCGFVLVAIAGALLAIAAKLFESSLGHLRDARAAAARAEARVDALNFRLEHVQYAVEDGMRQAAERQARFERVLRGDLPPAPKVVEPPADDDE